MPIKRTVCSICKTEVNKAQTYHVGGDQRACKIHQGVVKGGDALKASDIKAALVQALAGSRKLKLTFNRDAFVDIFYLLGMTKTIKMPGPVSPEEQRRDAEKRTIIEMNEWAYMNLYAVASSKQWEGVSREVLINLPASFDAESEEWFLGRMNARALEKITIA